jgi:hypothetical protein
VFQLHEHNFPVYDTSAGDVLYAINDATQPYRKHTGLTPLIDTDSLGGAIINNKFFTVVLWGVVSEEDGDCKIMMNLPSGSYVQLSDALNDVNKYTNYTVPEDYVGTGFLLTEFTCKRTTTNITIVTDGIKDLRGLFPASGGGGGTTGGAGITRWTELIDTPIAIEALRAVRGNITGEALEFYDPIEDKNFVYSPGAPLAVWPIEHNLNKYPSVTVLDSGGTTVEGQIDHVDLNNLTISFNSSFTGTATLN